MLNRFPHSFNYWSASIECIIINIVTLFILCSFWLICKPTYLIYSFKWVSNVVNLPLTTSRLVLGGDIAVCGRIRKRRWSVAAGAGIRDVILLKVRNYLDFCDFFLIVFNLRTARNWHMWQHMCVCFLYLRLYRDWILGVQILVEKERLKTTEFWKTWRQEGKDPTKPKFPNKLFHEKWESVRERKYVLHIRQVWIVFYCRFETKLFWAEFLNWELYRCL